MDVLDQLHGAHWADASERLRLVNLAADEIERLRETLRRIKQLNPNDYFFDGYQQALARKLNEALGELK